MPKTILLFIIFTIVASKRHLPTPFPSPTPTPTPVASAENYIQLSTTLCREEEVGVRYKHLIFKYHGDVVR
jgi:hypothetical protein